MGWERGSLIYIVGDLRISRSVLTVPGRRGTLRPAENGTRPTVRRRQTTNVLTVARVVVDQLVAGIASAAERVRQVHADLRTTAVVDQTLVHAARLLFLVLVAGTVRGLVAHLRHGYAYTATGLVVAAVELGERIAFVHGFLWKFDALVKRFSAIKSRITVASERINRTMKIKAGKNLRPERWKLRECGVRDGRRRRQDKPNEEKKTNDGVLVEEKR